MILAEPRVDPRQALGREGEAAAEAALVRAGLVVLERRFRVRAGEIDLIAERGRLLVFVEVKTRASRRWGPPSLAVNRAKRERLGRVAATYLALRGWASRPCRFDVVQVVAGPRGELDVEHIQDAFRLWPGG